MALVQIIPAVMATELPQIDLFDPIIRKLYDAYCESLPSELTDDELALAAGRSYNDGYKRPYVSLLMNDAVGPRWNLGQSQKHIAERLGIANDRAWLSRALRAGTLSLDIYVRLRFYPGRPSDWEPSSPGVQRAMERAGFIEVAKFLASKRRGGAAELDELTYELACALFARLNDWLHAWSQSDTAFALRVVKGVCDDPQRNVCPSWYTDARRAKTRKRIACLTADGTAAFNCLKSLHSAWAEVFVAATDAVHGLRWNQV